MNYKLLTLIAAGFILFSAASQKNTAYKRKTEVTIVGEQFFINGNPTYKGRFWNGYKVEGLLLNSRMVQGIFDDLNDSTRNLWAYPDTRIWDADRNTNEFIKNLPDWKNHGLLAFTLNLQGGSPYGYSNSQPWYNSAIDSLGELRKDYLQRLDRILNKADELGMVCILGIFYFGQEQRLKNEEAIKVAVVQTINWLHQKNYKNILIEINNECNINFYKHPILQPQRVHELIALVKTKSYRGHRYLVTTSFQGQSFPPESVYSVSDFVLCHGNGIPNTDSLGTLYDYLRSLPGYRPMPVINNEDDHYDFEKESNNFTTSIKKYVSWGFFDYRRKEEAYHEGFQSIPADWRINSERKKGFFNLMKIITGY